MFGRKLREEFVRYRNETLRELDSLREQTAELRKEVKAQTLRIKEISLLDIHQSDYPQVKILSSGIDSETGEMKLEIDWNDKFVAHLKKNGFEGDSDEELVNSWVDAVSRQVAFKRGDVYTSDAAVLDAEREAWARENGGIIKP